MRARPRWSWTVVILGALLSAGCDEVILFDLTDAGQLLVAADARGRSGLVGDSKRARHLFLVDPESGCAERLTRKPLHLAWPRACGRGALFVERRTRLVHQTLLGRRTLFVSKQKLMQPLVSPAGDRVAVLEAKQLGVTGTLLVIDLASGEVVHRVERALLGGTWTREALIVPRSKEARTTPFTTAPGEVLRIDAKTFRARPLFRARAFPAVTVLARASASDLIGVLHLNGAKQALGLARLSLNRRGARRGKVGPFDFWPTPAADGRRLLFTRSSAKQPSVQAQLRLATLAHLTRSTVVPTPGPVAAPRWVGPDRIAFLTEDDRLVLQDLDGANRLDLTPTLRAAFAGRSTPRSEETK